MRPESISSEDCVRDAEEASKMMQERLDRAAGLKHDDGKTRMDLLLDFSNALTAVGEVATMGAGKYEAHSWKTVPDAETRYIAAAMRHLFSNEGIDVESGLPHLAHAAWNLLAVLELALED